jgi:hypothetical protein
MYLLVSVVVLPPWSAPVLTSMKGASAYPTGIDDRHSSGEEGNCFRTNRTNSPTRFW